MTAADQAASDRKVAAADAYLRSESAKGADLASLVCVVGADGRDTSRDTLAATACDVPRGSLAVTARDQVRDHYCGPAVGQVIANYTWAVGANANKFLQARIAELMRTDVNGMTDAWNLASGLEAITRGAPRRPAEWAWVVTPVVDRDGDRTTGDELHGFVRANVSGSKMPLAISVKPHDPASRFHLPSWPRAAASPGHWVTVYGWLGVWDGTDAARVYYTDSSANQGGATGKFWTPTRHMAALIQEHHRRIVW